MARAEISGRHYKGASATRDYAQPWECPNCGAKIHTQPRGLGHMSLWMNSGVLSQTGKRCPNCGVALTGKVTVSGNRAILDTSLSGCAAVSASGVACAQPAGHAPPCWG